MFIMLAVEDTEALKRLIGIIASEEDLSGVAILARLLLLCAQGRYADACEIERPARSYHAFNSQLAFCHLCVGQQRDALELVRSFEPANAGSAWIFALATYCNGLDAMACNALERLLGRQVTSDQLLTVVVTMWARPVDPLGVYPSFFFPRLPAELTGLDHDISRFTRWDLEPDDVLARIRFPRPVEPDSDMIVQQGSVDFVTSDVNSGFNLTIAPNIITVANAEGGESMAGDRYEVGQAGAVGPNSTAHDIQFNQVWNRLSADTNLGVLADDLVKLRTAMRERATEPGQDLALAEVSQAQLAASEGDGPRALSHLARAGQWALGIASAIGANIAAAAIKSALGL